MPPKVRIIEIQSKFPCINLFWALVKIILTTLWLMSLSQAHNIFMPESIDYLFLLIITQCWHWNKVPISVSSCNFFLSFNTSTGPIRNSEFTRNYFKLGYTSSIESFLVCRSSEAFCILQQFWGKHRAWHNWVFFLEIGNKNFKRLFLGILLSVN